jgi:methyltransferase-like protein
LTAVNSVYSHSPEIVTRKTGNEYVLVPVANNIADMTSVYTLNESGAFIWELIDGQRNTEEIIDKVTAEYQIDRETAAGDVVNFINEMSNYLIINP